MDEVVNFFSAGQETVANGSFVFFSLQRYIFFIPEIRREHLNFSPENFQMNFFLQKCFPTESTLCKILQKKKKFSSLFSDLK